MPNRIKPIKVMVSSTVYYYEDQLQRVEAVLRRYGYTVIMSPAGTVPIQVGTHNFESCLRAVEECDVFLGIIRGTYGSGKIPGELSITHQEIRHAIKCDKPRFFAVDQRVDHARQLLRPLLKNADGTPNSNWTYPATVLKGNAIIDDIRVLEMYEEALKSDTPLKQRTNHWCQPYRDLVELLKFLEAQFRDRKRLRAELDSPRNTGRTG